MDPRWANTGSTLASFMFIWAVIRPYLPYRLESIVAKYTAKIFRFLDPNIQLKIHEYAGERFKRSEVFLIIQSYLAANTSQSAKRLKAEMGKDSDNLLISMDEHEQVNDEFKGAKFHWSYHKSTSRAPTTSPIYSEQEEQRHYYCLTFHKRHRQLVTDCYLHHVVEQGKAYKVKNRQRRLYTNSRDRYSFRSTKEWSHVVFEHPATFQTLAMDPEKKGEIIEDLTTFRNAKDYYAKIGKAWKRGYLLYGPPGTGKSTMIAAMANFLQYDVYDLELTAVKDNMELRKLLIEITSKSIIVLEDIDCSLDMSVKRTDKAKESKDKDGDEKKDPPRRPDREEISKVTLSGLLNFIDGLWSACGGERIIVITTNHVEKLDAALIRRGRMDKHIELSYCSFEGFKVLAKNYLDIDSHPLFGNIQQLLEETTITPADVAENLMPRSSLATEGNVATCLGNLIHALQKAKEEALRKAEEEEIRLKAEQNGETTLMDNKGKKGDGEIGNNENRKSIV